MRVQVNTEDTDDEKWFEDSLNRLLSRAWSKGVKDAIMIRVFWEIIEDIGASAELVQATLADLRGDGEDEEDEQEAEMFG